MTLDEQIRAKLQQQRTRWVWQRFGNTDNQQAVQIAYRLSDLGACHQAIRAVLDLHQPGTFGGYDLATAEDDATVAAIAEALNIQQKAP